MDKIVDNLKHRLQRSKNKKGMTMFSLFLIIVVIIFLTIIFSNPDFIRKINRGKVTTAWSNELSSLSNGVLSLNNYVNVLYPIRIKGDGGLDVVVPSPPLSAYESVQKYDIMKVGTGGTTLQLSYDYKSTVTAGPTGAVPGISMSSPTVGTVQGDSITLNGLSKLGSAGITSFVNKSIPNIEESLFLGLLNQSNSDIGTVFTETGKLDLTDSGGADALSSCKELQIGSDGLLKCKTPGDSAGKNTLEIFLSMVFGIGSEKDLQTQKQTSWISIKPVDSKAMKKSVGGNYRFYNTDDFNLFWVDSITPRAEAIAQFNQFFELNAEQAKKYAPGIGCDASGTDCVPNASQLAGEMYDRMLAYVQPDSIIVIPTTKSGSVYSSNSDFRLYKFSTTD